MSAFSNYLEPKLLDEIFNNTNFVPPATYISLYTSDPTDADSGTEVSGGSYARKLVNPNGGASPTWDLAVVDSAGYLVDNTHDITFVTATADWGTITHFGIHDAATVGNLLMYGALDNSRVVQSGGTFTFSAGELNLRVE
jgi:hypothetical protein